MNKQILLMSDMVGYGKVALSAMMPILSYMKHNVYTLPTALVSNTLDYGTYEILETTDYMSNTIKVWEELGFSFDAVSAGFLVSGRQAKLVADFCRQQKEKGALIFVDPIMGDAGRLYNGITETTVSLMRELIRVSDYMMPNYTEAACLAGETYREEGMSLQEADVLIAKLLSVGAKSIVVTSAVIDGQEAVLVYDHNSRERHILPFTSIPVRVPGTGDIFSSIFMGKLLEGKNIVESVQKAMSVIELMIRKNQEKEDRCKWIPVERFFDYLD